MSGILIFPKLSSSVPTSSLCGVRQSWSTPLNEEPEGSLFLGRHRSYWRERYTHLLGIGCTLLLVTAAFLPSLRTNRLKRISNNQTGSSQLFIDPSPACNHNKKGDMLGHPGAAVAAVIMMFVADTFRVLLLVDYIDRDVISNLDSRSSKYSHIHTIPIAR